MAKAYNLLSKQYNCVLLYHFTSFPLAFCARRKDLDKGYIAPDTALKKLRAERSLKQTVYISCGEDTAALTVLAEDTTEGTL